MKWCSHHVQLPRCSSVHIDLHQLFHRTPDGGYAILLMLRDIVSLSLLPGQIFIISYENFGEGGFDLQAVGQS